MMFAQIKQGQETLKLTNHEESKQLKPSHNTNLQNSIVSTYSQFARSDFIAFQIHTRTSKYHWIVLRLHNGSFLMKDLQFERAAAYFLLLVV